MKQGLALNFKDTPREDCLFEGSALTDLTCCGRLVRDARTGDVIIMSGGILIIGSDVAKGLLSPQELLSIDDTYVVELPDGEDTRSAALDTGNIEVLPEIFQCDSVEGLWTALEDCIW